MIENSNIYNNRNKNMINVALGTFSSTKTISIKLVSLGFKKFEIDHKQIP